MAQYLLAYLPEIGKLSHKALSALVGIAPFNNESGMGQGKRFIQGGRSRLRQVLYMSGIAAIMCNQDLKVFYMRLKAQKKPFKLAIIAVIRKLLTMANSVIKRQTAWVTEYQKKLISLLTFNINAKHFLKKCLYLQCQSHSQ